MNTSDHDVISLDDEDDNQSSSNDDAEVPEDVATCQRLVEKFAEITGTDEACAQFYLQDHKWNVERSVNAYYENLASGASNASDSEVVITFDSKSVPLAGQVTDEAPKNFRFLTWNIDGLDEKNLKKRTKTIAKIIEIERADIVFLQEVVPATYSYLESLLPQFVFIVSDNQEYFTATLLRQTTVYFDGHNILPFENTVMGRNLLCVEAHIGDVKLSLLNTHLESTAEFSKQRVEQLKIAINKMKSNGPKITTIFGGDLNLRDRELAQIGQPPDMHDLWEACGRRPECKWTWDTERNTNKQHPGKFKPKMRFDRIYLKPSTPPVITPRHFGLVGLQKVTGTQSFPSDHWGLLVHFEVVDPSSRSSQASAASSSCPSTSDKKGKKKRKRYFDM